MSSPRKRKGEEFVCVLYQRNQGDKGKGSTDLDEGIKSLLLVVLRDDFCQELVLTLGQFDKGTHTVNVGVDLDVEHIVPPCKGKMSLRESQIRTELPAALLPPGPRITQRA